MFSHHSNQLKNNLEMVTISLNKIRTVQPGEIITIGKLGGFIVCHPALPNERHSKAICAIEGLIERIQDINKSYHATSFPNGIPKQFDYLNHVLSSISLQEGLKNLQKTYPPESSMIEALHGLKEVLDNLRNNLNHRVPLPSNVDAGHILVQDPEEEEKVQPPFHPLTRDTLTLIFENLSLSELFPMRKVCKMSWHVSNFVLSNKFKTFLFPRSPQHLDLKFCLEILKNCPFVINQFDLFQCTDPFDFLNGYKKILKERTKKEESRFAPVCLEGVNLNRFIESKEKDVDLKLKTRFKIFLTEDLRELDLQFVGSFMRAHQLGLENLFENILLTGLKTLTLSDQEGDIGKVSSKLKRLEGKDLKTLEAVCPRLTRLTVRQFALSTDFIEALRDTTLKIEELILEESYLARGAPLKEALGSRCFSALTFLAMPRADHQKDLIEAAEGLAKLGSLQDLRIHEGAIEQIIARLLRTEGLLKNLLSIGILRDHNAYRTKLHTYSRKDFLDLV